LAPGREVVVEYVRMGQSRTTKLLLEENPFVQTRLFEDSGAKPDAEMLKRRAGWLGAK